MNLKKGYLSVNQDMEVETSDGKKFTTKVRLDTEPEIQYF